MYWTKGKFTKETEKWPKTSLDDRLDLRSTKREVNSTTKEWKQIKRESIFVGIQMVGLQDCDNKLKIKKEESLRKSFRVQTEILSNHIYQGNSCHVRSSL